MKQTMNLEGQESPQRFSHAQQQMVNWFAALRDRLCAVFEELEEEAVHPNLLPGKFQQKHWSRHDPSQPHGTGGGGVMSVMQGRVFEKIGVNISTVWGKLSETFSHDILGAKQCPDFWAAGISLVAHPLNPYVPIIHMNTRYLSTSQSWIGGGIDLTPTFPFPEDTQEFHHQLRALCERVDPAYYAPFKVACDDYFYLKHRQEPRGVGGIFYDHFTSGSFEKDFALTCAIGEGMLDLYPPLVRRHQGKSWGVEEKQKQLIKRGRYVEFNLLYDRGTRFGLETQGNIDAIFMSLPPLAMWGE